MDTETLHDSTVSIVDGDIGVSPNNDDSSQLSPSNGDATRDLKRAKELLIRIELDIACSTEKICNLNILMMRVASRESDLEAVDNEEDNLIDSAEKVLEFDFLSEIFHSTLKELEDVMTTLYDEIVCAREITSSCKHMGESLSEIEEKLRCAEETARQSQEQITDMKMQSKIFKRSLVNLSGEEYLDEDDRDLNIIENGEFPLAYAKIEMQTSEQQRNILRRLEKSLATELDLEQKLNESKEAEEELKTRLLFTEREVIYMEEEMTSQFQRLFEAENAAELFKGVSVELVSQLQSCHFGLNCALKREAELRSKMDSNEEALNSENGNKVTILQEQLATAESEAESLQAKLKQLEEANLQLKEQLETSNLNSENGNKVTILQEQLATTESAAESLQAKLKQLEEANLQLKEQLETSTLNSEKDKMITALQVKLATTESAARSAQARLKQLEEANLQLKEQLETSTLNSENGKITALQEQLATAESVTGSAEAKLKQLEEANLQLKEQLETSTSDKCRLSELVKSLERQLKEADIQLQLAVTSVEASQEKQSMLSSSIKDMDIVIGNLKGKVEKAENRADDAEDKLIMLSESNAQLNDDVRFLRGRLEDLEASLNQSEEGKAAIVKDINVQSKLITDLVMRLEMERENIYKQVASLMKENKFLMDMEMHDMQKKPPTGTNINTGGSITQKYSLSSKEKLPGGIADADVPSDLTDVQSTLENVHTIDAGRLGFRHALVAILVGLISIVAVCYLHPESCPFGDLFYF